MMTTHQIQAKRFDAWFWQLTARDKKIYQHMHDKIAHLLPKKGKADANTKN